MMMMQGESGMLIYDWEGVDDLVDGYWVDRVSGVKARAKNSPTHDTDGYLLDTISSPNIYFDFSDAGLISFGRHWRIEVEINVDTFTNDSVFYDFGAYRQSNLGQLVGYNQSTNRLYVSYKFTGNDNTYSTSISPITLLTNTRYKIISGCKKYDAENDVQFLKIGSEKAEGIPHPSVVFHGNFGIDACFGKGARGAKIKMKLFSLRIYNDD